MVFQSKIKQKKSLLGLKIFSLQSPRRRGGLMEWIWHKMVEKEGLITPKFEFYELIVNGKSWGTYNLEEHFAKQIIERNKFREGPIIKFDESVHWKYFQKYSNQDLAKLSLVTFFNTKEYLLSNSLQQSFIQANQKIQAFIHNELNTDQVFDVDKVATLLALTSIMGASHSSIYHNTRYYYNPITTLLEPIPFDGNCSPATYRSFYNPVIYKQPWVKKLLTCQKLKSAYLHKLHAFTKKDYLDDFFQEIEEKLTINQKKLRTVLRLDELDIKQIYSNTEKIKEELENEN